MTKASERQVGGEHYKTTGISHWDYVVEVNVPYLEGCATKYISRWRKKNGVQDLQKALHYIERRIEALENDTGVMRGARENTVLFQQFCSDNALQYEERLLCHTVMHWKTMSNLLNAVHFLEEFIRDVERAEEEQFQKEISLTIGREGK